MLGGELVLVVEHGGGSGFFVIELSLVLTESDLTGGFFPFEFVKWLII